MRVCITSSGRDLNSQIEPRFGRTPYFIIVDTETESVEILENIYAQNMQGAGTGSVGFIVDKGVNIVLTGQIGPKALAAFGATGIRLVEGVPGNQTIAEVLEKFSRGEYERGETSSQQAASVAQPQGQGPFFGAGRGMGGGKGRGMGCGGGRRKGGGGGRGQQ